MSGSEFRTAPSVCVMGRQGAHYIVADLLTDRRFEVSSDVARLLERLQKVDAGSSNNPTLDPETLDFLVANRLLIEADQPEIERTCRIKPVRPRLFNLPSDGGREAGPNLQLLGLPFGRGGTAGNSIRATPDALRKYAHEIRVDQRCFGDTRLIERLLDLPDLGRLAHHAAGNRLRDVGNLFIYDHEPRSVVYEKIERTARRIVSVGDVPFFLGGDHSVTLPVLKACAAHGAPVRLLQIDAHTDTYLSPIDAVYAPFCPHNHANFVTHALDLGHLASVDQFGIRGLCNLGEPDRHPKLRTHTLPEIREQLAEGGDFGLCPDGHYYLSIDIDALDPTLAPGTNTAVPGGLSYRDFFGLLNHLMRRRRIVGIDLVEVDAGKDVQNRTLELALQIIVAVMAWWECDENLS